MKLNELIHGFEFTSIKDIPELQGKLCEAVYKKNGAKLLFIDRPDNNKTFAICFKTIPENDTGVFHIIEHSVLCGSKKYPVKEPFVALLQGSLKTFLNAFTFPDKTMYPVSSRNDKDFLNLVDVYMDAVLHPTAMTKPEIFYQEGWHYELSDKTEDMTYKGVVFNEMKGAYSSADEVEMEEMSSLIYRGNCYGKDSGGNPEHITELTYEEFVASHAKYYHPSNARIILDGSIDLDKTLALLDSFLSEYDELEIDSDIPMITPSGHVEKTVKYEIAPGEDADGKSRVALGFLTADFSDRRLIAALNIVTDAIAGSNDAPFKKAILDTSIAEDVNFVSYDGVQQNSIFIDIKNVKEEDMQKAKELVFSTLSDIVKNGIDKNALTASFNSLEFRIREQDMATFPAGVAYAISALDTWLYGGDPKSALSFEEDIAYLREMLSTDYYEKILEKYILNSNHSATLYMIPSETLGKEKSDKEKEKLLQAKSAMTDEEIERVITLTEEIETWQKSTDTQEALATLPSLSVSDISEMPEKYPMQIYTIDEVPALFTQTNSRGITYATLLFDISDFNEDELFFTSILSELYKNVGTDSKDAVSLQTDIKTELGTFSTGILVGSKKGKVTTSFQVAISALDSKLDSAVRLSEEILLHSSFEDLSAIEKIIKQLKTSCAEGIAASGHSAALARASAYVSKEAAVSEYTDGIENYLRIKELDKNFSEKSEELKENLEKITEKIFSKARLTVCHSGKRNDDFAKKIASVFKKGTPPAGECKIEPLGKRFEGILIPASVSYASMAGNVLKYEENSHGALAVVRSILSFGYLWNVIRVQGGAYGAGFVKRNNGTVGYYTYRDPNPSRSVDCFMGSSEFLRDFANSDSDIETFIIGAAGDADPLITPKVLSALSIAAYLRAEEYEDRVKRRKELLNTSKEDLLKIADLLDKCAIDSGVCIVGGKEALEDSKEKITSIIEI